MSYPLKPKESVIAGIERSARDELRKALKEIGELADDKAVHEIRKRFKRVRALLRLVREPLGEKAYRALNTLVRDAGRPLAAARDAQVLIATLEKLKQEHAVRISEDVLEPLRRGLETALNATRAEAFGNNDAADTIRDCIKDARKQITHWDIAASDREAVWCGMGRMYGHARECHRAASVDPSIENLHEWRKQAKYLRNQIEFLEPLRPRLMKPLAERLHRLGDLLGDDHDLAILLESAIDHATDWGAERCIERLLPPSRARRAHLQEQAIDLGNKLFDRTPEEFVKHFKPSKRAAGRPAVSAAK